MNKMIEVIDTNKRKLGISTECDQWLSDIFNDVGNREKTPEDAREEIRTFIVNILDFFNDKLAGEKKTKKRRPIKLEGKAAHRKINKN